MHKLQVRRLDMIRAVRVFGTSHSELFPEGSLARELMDTVIAADEELLRQGTIQFGGLHDASVGRRERITSRKALRLMMESMARTAGLIVKTMPSLQGQFKLPLSHSDEALLQAGRQFVENAVSASDAFVRHGMRADFIEELKVAIESLQNAEMRIQRARAVHREATAALGASLKTAMGAIESLDIVIANSVRDEPTLQAWRTASHVKRAPSKKAAATAAGAGG